MSKANLTCNIKRFKNNFNYNKSKIVLSLEQEASITKASHTQNMFTIIRQFLLLRKIHLNSNLFHPSIFIRLKGIEKRNTKSDINKSIDSSASEYQIQDVKSINRNYFDGLSPPSPPPPPSPWQHFRYFATDNIGVKDYKTLIFFFFLLSIFTLASHTDYTGIIFISIWNLYIFWIEYS